MIVAVGLPREFRCGAHGGHKLNHLRMAGVVILLVTPAVNLGVPNDVRRIHHPLGAMLTGITRASLRLVGGLLGLRLGGGQLLCLGRGFRALARAVRL